MSCTYFDTDDFEFQQGLLCSTTFPFVCELDEEAYSYFLAHGSLDQDVELN